MAPREDIITSAVAFLQDPTVASSPLEKRVEFLTTKNLTQEEIELSLNRAGENAQQMAYQPQQAYSPQQYRPPPSNYNYPMNPYGDFRPPPPEPPKRDWRDWFIMATVVGGVGYGLWTLADRYVKPLIAPPTPPQLEQDKAAIDEQFNRAFALLDTLSADTAALKEAEQARTTRLDNVITDVESAVALLRTANQKREDDARRMEVDIRNLRESLPKAIESVEKSSERQLRDLSAELASLKTLMGNRFSGASTSAGLPSAASHTAPCRDYASILNNIKSGSATPSTENAPPASSGNTGTQSFSTTIPSGSTSRTPLQPSSASNTNARPASTASFGAAGGKAAIPAWQMNLQNKQKDAAVQSNSDSAVNGDGAEAVAALAAS